MRFLLFITLFGLILFGSANAATVLVMGDSLSAAYGLDESDGWVALAKEELVATHPELEMVNASISGDTTEGGLRRLPAAIERFNPDVLIIELGGNDGLRGYPIGSIKSNLVKLATIAKDAGAEVLILGMRIPSNYGPDYTEQFAQTFADAAEESGSELVPFFLEPIAFDANNFLPDGIHPNADAQPPMMQIVVDKLDPMLQRLSDSAPATESTTQGSQQQGSQNQSLQEQDAENQETQTEGSQEQTAQTEKTQINSESTAEASADSGTVSASEAEETVDADQNAAQDQEGLASDSDASGTTEPAEQNNLTTTPAPPENNNAFMALAGVGVLVIAVGFFLRRNKAIQR